MTNTDSILKYRQLTYQISFSPNSNVLEKSILIPNVHDRTWWKIYFEQIHSSLYICAGAGENLYPLRNIQHLACVNFIDHVTVTMGLWSLPTAWQAVCQQQLHLDLPTSPKHTNTLFGLWTGFHWNLTCYIWVNADLIWQITEWQGILGWFSR